MTMRAKVLIGGILIGLAVLASSTGVLVAQEPTAMPGSTAMAGQMDMTDGATPGADDAEMAAQMERMMEQCASMMEMMTMMMGMMGGDMSGMMDGEDMSGMGGADATPSPAP